MTGPELIEFFKDLVHGLESEVETPDNGISLGLNEFRKLKISVKKHDGEYTLKLKVKRPEVEAEQGGESVEETVQTGEPDVSAEAVAEAAESQAEAAQEKKPRAGTGGKKIKYKHLKKRMDKTWDAIMDSAEAGQMPPRAATLSFLQDSALMVTYTEKDKGPEYYDDYIQAYKEFQEAYEAGDMPRIVETVQVLEKLKKECHAEYK
jgi:XXXCH domain-containing protein